VAAMDRVLQALIVAAQAERSVPLPALVCSLLVPCRALGLGTGIRRGQRRRAALPPRGGHQRPVGPGPLGPRNRAEARLARPQGSRRFFVDRP